MQLCVYIYICTFHSKMDLYVSALHPCKLFSTSEVPHEDIRAGAAAFLAAIDFPEGT